MKSHLFVGLGAAIVSAGLVLVGFRFLKAGDARTDQPVISAHREVDSRGVFQPDTASPSWKPISNDLGIWIEVSDRQQLHGRLYVRVGASWQPVGVDGAADIQGMMPVR
jgi:hypothetical protein